MRQDYISQMSQSPMPSKLSSHSKEGKAEDEVKEEGTIKVTLIPVEEIDNNIPLRTSKVKEINNTINIRISSLKEAEGEGLMTKPAYNAITAKSMGTMNLNAGRSRQINSQEEHMCQVIWETPQEVCFSHAIKLNNNLKISGC
jgi:hypothetical protein